MKGPSSPGLLADPVRNLALLLGEHRFALARTTPIDPFRQYGECRTDPPPDSLNGEGKLQPLQHRRQTQSQNGWYLLHLDGTPWGQAGSWDVNGGDPVLHWSGKVRHGQTQVERDNPASAATGHEFNVCRRSSASNQRQRMRQRLAAATPCTSMTT
jgi:hypothetical protein